MTKRILRLGVIGYGLIRKEFASAAARWCHLQQVNFEPCIVAVCDTNLEMAHWFSEQVSSVTRTTTDYHELLADPDIDAIYCAVPHNLHSRLYVDIIRSGKHLLGEKPFGIDLEANRLIMAEVNQHPNVLVRCSSELPFFPGAYRIGQWIREGRFGKIMGVEAGLNSS